MFGCSPIHDTEIKVSILRQYSIPAAASAAARFQFTLDEGLFVVLNGPDDTPLASPGPCSKNSRNLELSPGTTSSTYHRESASRW